MTEQAFLQIQPARINRDEYARIAETEGLGYEVLELSVPPALNESGLFEMSLKWYKKSGRVHSVHGNFIDVNPASGDSLFRELSRKRCELSCEVAVQMGAHNVVFHSSCFTFLRGAYLEGWAALCADFYEELADRYDLNIYIENSPDIDPEPIRTLMEIIHDERIGVCLDLGHAHYSQTKIAGWFDALGEHIGYLHLSDNNGIYDDHLPLGEGTIDWQEADRLYRSLNKNIPMTLEVGGPEGLVRSVSFLKSNGYFGIS